MEKEFLTKAIVLNSIDYKEKDKQLTLFSLDSGKITAVLKGCKNANAKLKFAFNPFCFAEYQIVQKSNFNTIINASLIDSFFDLSLDYNSYILASVMLEISQNIVKFNEPNYPIFIILINSLKAICYEKINPKMVLIKFCLTALENLGYKLQFKECDRCKMPFLNDKFLDLSSGEFVCNNCKNMLTKKISNLAFNSLKILDFTSLDRIKTVKISENALNEILMLLLEDLECRIERKLSSKKMLNPIL